MFQPLPWSQKCTKEESYILEVTSGIEREVLGGHQREGYQDVQQGWIVDKKEVRKIGGRP